MRLWFSRAPVRTVQAYVAAMNARDLDTMTTFMGENMLLVDSAGQELEGRPAAQAVFSRLFSEAKTFELRIDRYSYSRGQVLMSGHLESDHPAISNSTHFRARADESFVHEWQSYASHPVQSLARIMRNTGRPQPPA